MNREEAKETDLKRLEVEYTDGTKEFQISSMKVYKLIDKIYDDIESRTCENCKHFIQQHRKHGNYCGILSVNKTGFELDNFGCNKFERKT